MTTTTDKLWSDKVTRAFGSGELKKDGHMVIQSHLPKRPPPFSGQQAQAVSFNPAHSFFLYILTGLSGHLSDMASGL